jgi:hypothetical protein
MGIMPIDIIGKFSEKPQFHQFFHTFGEGRVRVIMVRNIEMFCFAPPHPNPLPQGERGFPDKN